MRKAIFFILIFSVIFSLINEFSKKLFIEGEWDVSEILFNKEKIIDTPPYISARITKDTIIIYNDYDVILKAGYKLVVVNKKNYAILSSKELYLNGKFEIEIYSVKSPLKINPNGSREVLYLKSNNTNLHFIREVYPSPPKFIKPTRGMP